MAKKSSSLKRKNEALLKEFTNSRDFVPWVDFSPSSLEELAVHKKKVSEVQAWIQKAFSSDGKSKESPVLLLTGPPGVGKTATVNTICKICGAEVFVWSNTHQDKSWSTNEDILFSFRNKVEGGETQAVSFSRFLLQSAKYSLNLNTKRIIIVEEFPNALIRDPTVFHNIIKKYTFYGHCPAVFIISDSVRGESLENRLFPKDLQLSLKILNISFNPVAPTMLMKVLSRINNSSKVQSCYTRLSKAELESIASDCTGDIRNAINSMQFLCMSHFKKPQLISKTKNKSSNADLTSKRDSSLFLFHALGKILYSKRDATLKSEKDVLPEHLKQFEKDPLISNAEDVYDKTSISAEGFSLFLQENYLPFVETVDVVSDCSAWLSEADILSAQWSCRDVMNDYMVSIAARGLMFNLKPCSTGKRWRPLHKPQFYENNAKQKQLFNALKHSFKGTGLNMRELQIDFVPFLYKLQLKSLNSAQLVLSNELGKMDVKRFTRQIKTLDEKDSFPLETADCDSTGLENVEKEIMDNVLLNSDEEVVIEEYDF